MEHTAISWCDSTFNPWIGCTKVSPACDHCYAERLMDTRLGRVQWGAGQARKRTSAATWRQPLAWERDWENFLTLHGRRRRVFCASLADVFDNEVDPQWRADLFALINATPHLDWLLLTKRIGNAAGMLAVTPGWLPPNVWLGATICNQAEADRDIPKLLALPARVRFLSIEPMLGPVNLTRIPMGDTCASECCGNWRLDVLKGASYCGEAERDPRDESDEADSRIDWVICGGESGPQARPMHPDWVRSLRDQCAAAGVPFHFKQWGEWLPISEQSDAFNSALYRSNRRAMAHEDQGAVDELYGRTCSVGATVVHSDGSLHDPLEPMAFLQGTDPMTTFRVGTKAAGRLLDGIEHHAFPT